MADGKLCVSLEDVPIGYCKGACASHDQTSVYSFNGNDVLYHEHECKCCSGEGKLHQRIVDCEGEERKVMVKTLTSCGCNTCGGGTGKYNKTQAQIISQHTIYML